MDRPTTPARQHVPRALVACSGGADSLALAAAVAFEATRNGVRASAVVIDHGLQPGSDRIAATAADQCRGLGLDPVRVMAVRVDGGGGEGLEAAARRARYGALEQAAACLEADAVLLGHTRDDQAEQVLLGLLRGSGARSLSGMRPARDGLGRPFLGLPRETTLEACQALGLRPWSDPHNEDPRFLRVRVRTLLAHAEETLGPGVRTALSRSADLLRIDADTLDEQAADTLGRFGPGPWAVAQLASLPSAVRRRVWRLLAAGAGCPPGRVASVHVDALDGLVTCWRGQGPVALPGGIRGQRRADRVSIAGPES